MDYFYILPFNDKKHIKVGISSDDITRVITHEEGYSLNLSEILILKCHRRSLAQKVERYVLKNTEKPESSNKYNGIDGHTEIRSINDLNKIKGIINKIKTDPEFRYSESKILDYKLYTLDEWINKFSESNPDIISQANKLTNKKTNNLLENKKTKKINNNYITCSDSVYDALNEYSLYLIKKNKINPMGEIITDILNRVNNNQEILDDEQKIVYFSCIERYKDKPVVINYKSKTQKNYIIKCKVEIMVIITLMRIKLISDNVHIDADDFDFKELMFRSVLQYLHLDKNIKNMAHNIINYIK
jgi:hypothetical protein